MSVSKGIVHPELRLAGINLAMTSESRFQMFAIEENSVTEMELGLRAK